MGTLRGVPGRSTEGRCKVSNSIWYRVMCDRHNPPVPVADIEHDKTQAAAQRYDQASKGEVPLRDSFGDPAPQWAATPYRRSSGEITVYPQTGVKIPELGLIRTARVALDDEQHADGH